MKNPIISRTRLANYLVAVVLVLVPFHAFLTVFGSTLIGHYTALRLWDEVILLAVLGIVTGWLITDPVLRAKVSGSLLFRLIGTYVGLTIALGLVALVKHEVSFKALGFALAVNLRFVLWFAAVYIVASRSDWLRSKWRPLFWWPVLVVCLFALLQFFVLSPKFLAHFGYDSLVNVAPVTTINQSTNTVRVQSFLRGPNPLGAYLVLVLGLLAAAVKWKKAAWRKWLLGVLASATLLLTFSRSAWIGTVVAGLAALFLRLKTHRSRIWAGAISAGIVVVAAAGMLAFSGNSGVQDAVLHVTPESHVKETSNQGHSTALRQGLHDLVHEPFGRGPGTAGPSSIYNAPHGPRNSENYFLEIGLETGWAGLLLFAAITVVVGLELWQIRSSMLGLGLLVTLIGLTIVNQFAYAWSDDTLAFIWWGLAAIALAKAHSVKTRETDV